jgi:hypothetical protein
MCLLASPRLYPLFSCLVKAYTQRLTICFYGLNMSNIDLLDQFIESFFMIYLLKVNKKLKYQRIITSTFIHINYYRSGYN